MKKLLKITIVLALLLLVGATTVNAATPKEFLNYVTSPVTIDGKSVTLVTASQKAEIERYISENKISDDTLNYLKGKFDEGVKVLQDAKVTDINKLTDADKAKIEKLANEASEETGIKFTVGSNGSVTVYNIDGTEFTKTSPTIKQTGSSNYEYIYVPAIAIVAVAIVLVTRRTLKNAR